MKLDDWGTLAAIAVPALGVLVWLGRMGLRAWRWWRSGRRAEEWLAEANAIRTRAGASPAAEVTVALLTARDERAAKVIVQRGLGEVRGQTLAIADRRPGSALAQALASYGR